MTFTDVEALCIAFLEPVTDVEWFTSVPNPRPDRFGRVWRNGGPSRNRVIDRPLITLEGWSLDSTDASEILETARSEFLNRFTRMPLMRRVQEITGPYSIPDPESETPRYRCTLQLTVRAPRS